MNPIIFKRVLTGVLFLTSTFFINTSCKARSQEGTNKNYNPHICRDGRCTGMETAKSCPSDCLGVCPDAICLKGKEDSKNCPQDCGARCGDGICHPNFGEMSTFCPQDCGTKCGDRMCHKKLGETKENCPQDCVKQQ